jgi:hypothetical protein
MRRTHEVQVRTPVKQRVLEIGDVGTAGREHPRVFGAEHPLSEQRHRRVRLPLDVLEQRWIEA